MSMKELLVLTKAALTHCHMAARSCGPLLPTLQARQPQLSQ